MLAPLSFSFDDVIIIIGLLIPIVGVYWNVQLKIASVLAQVAAVNKKIGEIECDREIKWKDNREIIDKLEAYLSDIAKGVNEMRVDIKELKTDMGWVKKK